MSLRSYYRCLIFSTYRFKAYVYMFTTCHNPGCTARGSKRPFCCHSFPGGAASGGNLTCQFTHTHTHAHRRRNSTVCQLALIKTYLYIEVYYFCPFLNLRMTIYLCFQGAKTLDFLFYLNKLLMVCHFRHCAVNLFVVAI